MTIIDAQAFIMEATKEKPLITKFKWKYMAFQKPINNALCILNRACIKGTKEIGTIPFDNIQIVQFFKNENENGQDYWCNNYGVFFPVQPNNDLWISFYIEEEPGSTTKNGT